MREILFRGKRTDNGEWVTGTPLFYVDRCKMMQVAAVHVDFIDDGCLYYSEGFPVDPETMGQYTGLRDRLGKRIFEGDIVKTPFCGNTLCDFLIQFINGGFYAVPPGIEIDVVRPWKHHLNGSNNKMVVIGNIHDNPELLEV